MVGWPGQHLSDPSTQLLCEQLSKGHVGGVLFLRHNMETANQVSQLTDYFSRCGEPFRPLLALDQEGGLVDRIGTMPGEPNWPSAEEIGQHPPGYAAGVYRRMAERIASLGFNVNFAPVADLNTNPTSPIIGRLSRTYGQKDIGLVLETFIAAHTQQGIATTLKHFPGHGSSRTDSHLGFADVTDTWQDKELDSFRDAMNQAGALMAGHLVHRDLDPSGLPASLSQQMLQSLLRDELGFQNVIVSDDMEMAAITDRYDFGESIVMGLSAGLDLYIHSNSNPYDSDLVDRYHTIVKQALDKGELRLDDMRASVNRIEAWKKHL